MNTSMAVTTQRETQKRCDYCGLPFGGPGSPDNKQHFCCYGCSLVQRITGNRGEGGIASWILIRLGIGAFLAMNVMMISLVLYTNSPSDLGPSAIRGLHLALIILSTPAIVILGGTFVLGSAKGIQRGRITMDTLIITGSIAAYGVSTFHVIRNNGPIYFDTATMLLLIVTVGRLLEASAKNRTSNAIKDLMGMAPATAMVVRDGVEVEIPSADVLVGDLVAVRPGERIATDGKITSGECTVEESAFTGESQPRLCALGDRVYGGSINLDGFLNIEATAVGEDALLGQIQSIVEQAQMEQAPVERLAERISVAFLPVVWIVAALAVIYWGVARNNPVQAGLSGLAVLVVACPCALGIATPMATCLAIGKAARSGVLIRSTDMLEQLPKIHKVFFDKTGTLTTRELAVVEVWTAGDLSWEEAIAWTATLESASEHLSARAIVDYAEDKDIPLGIICDFHAIPGKGASGVVSINHQEKSVTVGSLALLSVTHRIPESFREIDATLSTVFVGLDGEVAAVIALKDCIAKNAQEVIKILKSDGIITAIMSGDREGPTRRVGNDLQFDEMLFECSPTDKVGAIRSALKAQPGIAMVGDGINDAPALAEADVGISMAGGTDLAREASDVTILGDDLMRIPWVIELSKLTYKIIRQNLWWAFSYNSVAMVLAFLGYVHPLIAAGAMVGSSLAVIANSMRLLK